MSDSAPILNEKRMGMLYTARQLDGSIRQAVRGASSGLLSAAARLEALSPLAVLARGYGVATDQEGNTVRSVDNVKKDDRIVLRVSDGTVLTTVQSIQKEKSDNGK